MLPWEDRFRIGHDMIDADHEHLFTLIGRFHDSLVGNSGDAEVAETLAELVDYTRSHFAREEALMSRHGYPGMDAHLRQHETMVRKVLDMQERLAGGDPGVGNELADFLSKWLVRHILGTDQKLAAFLASAG